MENVCLVKKDVWGAAWMIQEPAHPVLWGITCLNTTVIKSVPRRPTVKNLNAKRATPTVAAVTRTSVTGVKRASFSRVAAVSGAVALASTATQRWANVSPATEPVKPAVAPATPSAAAARQGCSCCRGHVWALPSRRWKANSGMTLCSLQAHLW